MQSLIRFVKKEMVLVFAVLLAVVSMFFVPPSANYVSYIDFRVLSLLFCLMTVMAGFSQCGLFDRVGSWLLGKVHSVQTLGITLVLLPFFFSMMITNDVALITFVPFALLMLKRSQQEQLSLSLVVMQTIAANLGSMLTPLGNPQNLYLYQLMDVSFLTFMGKMGLLAGVSLVLIVLSTFFICKRAGKTGSLSLKEEAAHQPLGRIFWVYLLLFLLCLLVVFRVMPYWWALLAVFAAVLLTDRKRLMAVDYSLLITFVAFFVFTGNIAHMESISQMLSNIVGGHELVMGVAISQVISNVPAALLLSGFAKDLSALLFGVNIGGLGTLIASMASLISYKLFVKQYPMRKGRYLLVFTVANVVFLAVLMLVAMA